MTRTRPVPKRRSDPDMQNFVYKGESGARATTRGKAPRSGSPASVPSKSPNGKK
jgi:hypothetical protein